DLVRYHERVAEYALPHLRGRPLALVGCGGEIAEGCAFLKHSKVWAPAALRRVRIPEKTKLGEYLVADTVEALVSLAQMDAVEIHTWNTRAEQVELPDRIVLDLDPGDEVSFAQVIEGARLLRSALSALRLESWVKTTGGRGLHVVVPVRPQRDWSECLAFSRSLCEAIANRDRRFTTAYARKGREQLILLDYLRNNRTNTSIAAFSPRAREPAPVSVPIAWDELTPRLDPAPRIRRSSSSVSSRRGDHGKTAGPETICVSPAGSFQGPIETLRSAVRWARHPNSRPRSRTSART